MSMTFKLDCDANQGDYSTLVQSAAGSPLRRNR